MVFLMIKLKLSSVAKRYVLIHGINRLKRKMSGSYAQANTAINLVLVNNPTHEPGHERIACAIGVIALAWGERCNTVPGVLEAL